MAGGDGEIPQASTMQSYRSAINHLYVCYKRPLPEDYEARVEPLFQTIKKETAQRRLNGDLQSMSGKDAVPLPCWSKCA